MLIQAPVLSYPDFTKPFTIYTDASGIGLGAVLSQEQEGKERVISYASRSLNSAEKNYTVTDQECLAVVWAIKHFQHYLGMKPFEIVTDHSALKWLQTCKMPKGRRARWIMELQQYTFTIKHRPGKVNSNADALSRIPEEEIYCFMVERGYESDSENEAECSRKKQKVQEDEPAQYLVDSQGNPIGRFSIQEPDLTGSQYLANLGPAPGESDDELEPLTYGQEDYYQYDSDNDSTWNPHYTDSYEDPDTMTIEEIREDGSSVVLSTYGKEDDTASIFRAYQYSEQELFRIYLSNIVVKQVIAGQPIKKGGSKCTDACYYGETVDHHTHTYCKCCKRNLFTDEVVHNCTWGIGPGELHPEMNPEYLVNVPWWPEPMKVQQENLYALLCYLECLYNNLPFYEQDLTVEIAELD